MGWLTTGCGGGDNWCKGWSSWFKVMDSYGWFDTGGENERDCEALRSFTGVGDWEGDSSSCAAFWIEEWRIIKGLKRKLFWTEDESEIECEDTDLVDSNGNEDSSKTTWLLI